MKGRNKKKTNASIPKTLADSIPYEAVYKNGIFELEPGLFSKSYRLPDTNFKTAFNDKQEQIAEKWANFLNTFDAQADVELSLYNKTVDINEFQQRVFIPTKPDHLNKYREEYNEMLLDKMTEAKNNIETEKILTVSMPAETVMDAKKKFSQIDATVSDRINDITGQDAPALTTAERLEMLNSIYNQDSSVPLYRKRTIQGHEVESFSLDNCAKQGITTKDAIAPSVIMFNSNDAVIGSSVTRTYYVSNYPSWIKGTILTDFTSMSANVLVSVYFKPIEQGTAMNLIKHQRTNIASEVLESQKRASRNGYSAELASPDTADAKKEAETLMDNMNKDNSRLFLVDFIITVFAPDMEHLKSYEEELQLIANKNLLTIRPAGMMQERAFNSSLPLGNHKLQIQRLMDSESVMSIIPFDVKEIRQKNGKYYGLNASSRNMIIYDRTCDVNMNGCILGMPGAGKSFAAKREMVNVLLGTDDEIYVIDPEAEYRKLAETLGGSVIKIANGSSVHINPFDMNMDNVDDDGGDPVSVKTDFITAVVEIAIGGRWGMSPIETSIVDRCVREVYDPYLAHIQRTGKKIDPEAAPTLLDFYNVLLMQPQAEAQNLALSLERYAKGALDAFSHRTNVDLNNRFTVYDISGIGAGLKEMGLQICLDNIWNKMIENHHKGKRTWFYIDEFYLLMQKKTSASYISEIWKRARKWSGLPTAITQNVEDMLKSDDARTVINNCNFITLLQQAPINRAQLCGLLEISPEESKYISSGKPGMGLLRIGETFVPMDDSFPKDTELYRIMTTKPDETVPAA